MKPLGDAPHKGEKHLIWGFIVTLLLLQGVAILVLIKMSAANREISASLNTQREKAIQVSIMRDAMRMRQVGLRDMVILPDPFLKDEAWQAYFDSATDFILARKSLEELGLMPEESLVLARLSEKASAAYEIQQAVVDMVYGGATVREVAPLLQVAIASQREAATEMDSLIAMQRGSAEFALQLSEEDYRETLWLLILVSALASLSAIVIAVVALARDRKLVRDLDNYRNHLQDLVTERTSQLEAMVEELGSFSYSLAHDLRQPLRGLDGYSFILLEDYGDTLDAAGRNYLQRIRAGSQRIGQLLDGMLTLCSLSHAHLQRTQVDLSVMCRDIAEQFALACEDRTVELKTTPGVMADADADLMRIALENLFANSFKFTAGKPHAVIEFGCKQTRSTPVYYIRDNGAGFDMQYSGKLFGLYERLHPTEEFEGTGIGLATVSRIIKRHGGRIWADAETGKGAMFCFTLKGGLE